MAKIAVIIGSTRDTRFAEKPANWILEKAKAQEGWDVELIDLKDYDLPFFNEAASNAYMPSQSEQAVAWQKKIAEFDGYIFVTPEYNRSITAALKNALDQSYVEWNHKPMGVVGYGSTGGARAVEHLRSIAIELQMVPVRTAVHFGGSDFMAIHPMGANGEISSIEDHVAHSADGLFADLNWWLGATIAQRKVS